MARRRKRKEKDLDAIKTKISSIRDGLIESALLSSEVINRLIKSVNIDNAASQRDILKLELFNKYLTNLEKFSRTLEKVHKYETALDLEKINKTIEDEFDDDLGDY